MFPTWPAKSEMMKRPKKKDVEHSPQAPEGGAMFAKLVSRESGVQPGYLGDEVTLTAILFSLFSRLMKETAGMGAKASECRLQRRALQLLSDSLLNFKGYYLPASSKTQRRDMSTRLSIGVF